MKVIITREQAIQIMGNERKLERCLYDSFTGEIFAGELAKLRTGAKLFSIFQGYGRVPIFEIRSGVNDGKEEDVIEIIKALEHGESGLMCGSQTGC